MTTIPSPAQINCDPPKFAMRQGFPYGSCRSLIRSRSAYLPTPDVPTFLQVAGALYGHSISNGKALIQAANYVGLIDVLRIPIHHVGRLICPFRPLVIPLLRRITVFFITAYGLSFVDLEETGLVEN